MPRIHLPSREELDDDQRAVYDRIVSGPRGRIQGPLRAALYNAELADKWQALGSLLRYRTSFEPRLSEIAILVTARRNQSPFEWYAHRLEAEKAGLEAPIIDAILQQRSPDGLSEQESIVHDFSVELCELRSVSDALYARALKTFGARAIVELTALVGYYTMVALTLNCHEIPLPEGVEPAFALPQHRGID